LEDIPWRTSLAGHLFEDIPRRTSLGGHSGRIPLKEHPLEGHLLEDTQEEDTGGHFREHPLPPPPFLKYLQYSQKRAHSYWKLSKEVSSDGFFRYKTRKKCAIFC
jgi:hypothetical protein